jgi:AcrR family transcriptional regulator
MLGARHIRERGFAAVDLDDIAKELGVAPDAARYWFNDETELLLSIMQIRQRWFLDEADARLAPLTTNTERLAALIDLCVADHDVTYWIELWKVARRDDRAARARQVLSGAYRDLFARLIRSGQRSGEFASVSPDQLALVLVGLVVGLSVEATVTEHAEIMHDVLSDATERLLGVDLGAD